MNPPERPTIHYTELSDLPPGSPLEVEWNTFRRELPRLLAEGHEGKFAVVKGDALVGIYDTWDAAREAGLKQYLLQPHMVQPIRAREPLLRIRGYSF
jgi:hypothetical protein